MSKFFPLDFKKLIKAGGVKFINKNPEWPVNSSKFHKLSTLLFKNLVRKTQKVTNKKKEVILTDFAFAFYIIQRVHLLIAKELLKKKNIKTLSSHSSYQFLLNNKNLSQINFEKKNYIHKIYFTIKKLFINLYLKKNYFLNRPFFLDFGGTTKIKLNYAKKNRFNLVKDYEFFYLKDFNSIVLKDEKNFYHNFVKDLICFYEKSVLEYFNVRINLKSLIKIWKNRLIQIESFIDNKSNQVNNFDGVLLENTTRVSSRIIACMFNRQKKKVFGFEHGNTVHNSFYVLEALNSILFNNYVTISKNSKKALEKTIIKFFDIKQLNKIKIISFSHESKLKKKFINNSKKKQHKIIKKIMIMGWPMNSRIYCDHAGYHFYSKLVFEVELIKILKKNGFYVIYKPHPERTEGISDFFKNLVDEIIYNKFDNEDVQKRADAYIFSHIGSSAMADALCTNKQVFLLDHITDKNTQKEHLKALHKRVNIINCKFSNKYELNEKKIISTINNPIKKIDFEYVRNFLF
tara:strand:+ start:5982 stop:7532 length:1551 start_codon:yes stop_codon:yes gene_type:complete